MVKENALCEQLESYHQYPKVIIFFVLLLVRLCCFSLLKTLTRRLGKLVFLADILYFQTHATSCCFDVKSGNSYNLIKFKQFYFPSLSKALSFEQKNRKHQRNLWNNVIELLPFKLRSMKNHYTHQVSFLSGSQSTINLGIFQQSRLVRRDSSLLHPSFEFSNYNYSEMAKTALITTIAAFIVVSMAGYTSPSQNLSFTLNSNLIINPNISSPTVTPNSFINYVKNQTGWTTTGTYVKYVDACIDKSNVAVCNSFSGVTCGWQFLGTDSGPQNENYYQNFNLTAGREFQLKFDWVSEIPPTLLLLTISSGFQVLWNGATVYSEYDGSCTLFTSTFYLISTAGTNQLSFQGLGTIDGYGILIRNVNLQELVYASNNATNSTNAVNTTNTTNSTNITNSNSTTNSTNSTNSTNVRNTTIPTFDPFADGFSFEDLEYYLNSSDYETVFKVVNFIKNFQISKAANTVFASKQNIRFLLGFILQFNHLLLYNYHLLNYTIMSNIILVGVQTLDDQKAVIIDEYIFPLIGTSAWSIQAGFQLQNDLPVNINNVVASFNSRPSGLLLQIMDTLFLDLPITVFTFFIGYLMFRLLFKSKISLLFRQYTIFGCFLCVILDGKIETGTFYFLSSALLLTNTNFRTKAETVAILLYYFGMFTIAIASSLLYRAFYGKVLKYIYENCKKPHQSTLHVWLNFGFYNILLGFAHRVLLQDPLLQLYVLISIETSYLAYLLFFLFRRRFESFLVGATLCAMNTARLAFILSFLVYEFNPDCQYDISVVQEYIFFSFIILWIFSSLLCFIQKMQIIYHSIMFECRQASKSRKVTPSSTFKSKLSKKKVFYSSPEAIRIIDFKGQQIDINLTNRLRSNTSFKAKQQISDTGENRKKTLVSLRNRRLKKTQGGTPKVTFSHLE